MKAATKENQQIINEIIFQSTPPVKAATAMIALACYIVKISIHAAREGGDSLDTQTQPNYLISIHAAREGGDCYPKTCSINFRISIHAAREGGDVQPRNVQQKTYLISIHAAREGGDYNFQSKTSFY